MGCERYGEKGDGKRSINLDQRLGEVPKRLAYIHKKIYILTHFYITRLLITKPLFQLNSKLNVICTALMWNIPTDDSQVGKAKYKRKISYL